MDRSTSSEATKSNQHTAAAYADCTLMCARHTMVRTAPDTLGHHALPTNNKAVTPSTLEYSVLGTCPVVIPRPTTAQVHITKERLVEVV